LRLFSFGGYGLALAALALVVFGAYDSYPNQSIDQSINQLINQFKPYITMDNLVVLSLSLHLV